MKMLSSYPYPGEKTKVIDQIAQHFPERFGEFRDLFTGGGCVSVYVMTHYPDTRVWINDIYPPVYCFWNQLQNNSDALLQWLFNQIGDAKPRHLKELGNHCIRTIHEGNEMEIGGKFYLRQKLSYSSFGTSAGNHQVNHFTMSSVVGLYDLAKLIQSRQVVVTRMDYGDLLTDDENTFLFADPPYKIDRHLYGKNGSTHWKKVIEHKQFCEAMMSCRAPWLMTYNDMPNLRKWLCDAYIKPFDVPYNIDHQRMGLELLVANYNFFEGLANKN